MAHSVAGVCCFCGPAEDGHASKIADKLGWILLINWI